MVRQLSERLVKLGHEVTVVTSSQADRTFSNYNGVQIRSFSVSGNAIEGYTGDVSTYQDFLLNETNQFDVITFFAAQQWATDIALPLLTKIRAVKVNVPTGYSHLYTPAYSEYFKKMKSFIKEYDMNVFLAEDYRDVNFANENGVTNKILIPNGAGEDEFGVAPNEEILRVLGVREGDFVLLHVGSFVHSKGQLDAVDIFLRSSLEHANLILVGNKPENFMKQMRRRPFLLVRYLLSHVFGSKKIIHVSLSRDKTVAIYHNADLFFFPSMIECSPIVLFEAMAASTPFLVTDVGNSKEIAKWSGGGWIMPTVSNATTQGFVRADVGGSVKLLNELWQNNSELTAAAKSGHKAWQEKFTWEKIALQYENLYIKLVESK